MTYQFLKAALVKVTYIDYKTVTEEEREDGRALFRYLTDHINFRIDFNDIKSTIMVLTICFKY